MEKKRMDDYEPGPVPSPRSLDRFGFVKPELNSSLDGLIKGRSTCEYEREERQVRKWRKMIGAGGSDWKHYVRRKPYVVRRRIRKGIPDFLKVLVWQLISGSWDLVLMNPGVYERHGPGQRSLYNVLKAYSFFDRDVGYVQDMMSRLAFYNNINTPPEDLHCTSLICFYLLKRCRGYPTYPSLFKSSNLLEEHPNQGRIVNPSPLLTPSKPTKPSSLKKNLKIS